MIHVSEGCAAVLVPNRHRPFHGLMIPSINQFGDARNARVALALPNGWVDLAAADAIPMLTRLARNPLLKAVRPMLQDLPDPTWILGAEVGRTLAALPRLGLRFDALVRPAQLPALLVNATVLGSREESSGPLIRLPAGSRTPAPKVPGRTLAAATWEASTPVRREPSP